MWYCSGEGRKRNWDMKGPGSILGCNLLSFNRNNLKTLLSDVKTSVAATVYKREICSDSHVKDWKAKRKNDRRPEFYRVQTIGNRREPVSGGARTVKFRS